MDKNKNRTDLLATGRIKVSVHEPSIGDSGNTDVHSVSGLSFFDNEPLINDSADTNADVHSASGIPSSDQEPAIVDSGDAECRIQKPK
ncbi:hypothetical protein L2E82_35750 [Cichorium intybus]|uniref:Uncharacterized protein n=1 Tax=Cichorium intybus TaxID=13427 RepID=A0ACB9BPN3_CICIN|nr:hypothetical protein L2E82_35750 [Cichorium intybus]